jgi:hypothetical protein
VCPVATYVWTSLKEHAICPKRSVGIDKHLSSLRSLEKITIQATLDLDRSCIGSSKRFRMVLDMPEDLLKDIFDELDTHDAPKSEEGITLERDTAQASKIKGLMDSKKELLTQLAEQRINMLHYEHNYVRNAVYGDVLKSALGRPNERACL